MANILVVEDDRHISELVKRNLSLVGHTCSCCYDGLTGLEVLQEQSFDLILLDVMLPGVSGFDFITQVSGTPIIFVTAKGELEDRLKGLTLGAEDYIVKPFSNIELLMRVKAILRRSSTVKAKSNTIILKDLTIERDSQSVTRAGERINLTYTEYGILVLLASHPKKIYSLDNIYDSIWGDDAVGDSSIMVHIKNLRKKIGDSSREPIYIKTAWGRGYYVD